MSIQADFSRGYPTAEAERGKFVVLDPSTITDLPSGSRGKYAVLVYNVNADGAGGGGGSVNITPIVAGLQDVEDAVNDVEVAVNNIQIEIPTLTNIDIQSTSIDDTLNLITFNQPIRRIEIFNTNPTSTVYLSLVPSAVSTFAELTSLSMPIERYYSVDFETNEIAIGATEASDVRIIGHY